MDINAKNGTRVVFSNPEAAYQHHQDTAGRYLIVGRRYTVDYIVVCGFHTDVFLKEVPFTAFNSVMFDDVEGEGYNKITFDNLIDKGTGKNVSVEVPKGVYTMSKKNQVRALIRRAKFLGKTCRRWLSRG